jgi:hypothetical protein
MRARTCSVASSTSSSVRGRGGAVGDMAPARASTSVRPSSAQAALEVMKSADLRRAGRVSLMRASIRPMVRSVDRGLTAGVELLGVPAQSIGH